jgi:signal transduction histidine kinase
MARRMREFDWSRNPLGNPLDWPQTLKTSVRIILTARQPMFVWWGTQLITLYNDGYAAFLWSKHPQALGEPASAVWPEIWDVVEPRVEFAMRQDEGTYDEAFFLIMHRKGYPEEVYATFSYSPIADDHGKFGGILCPVTEETERIIGERHLALLRELAARTADARTVKDACTLAADALGTNPSDLPFSLIYIIDPQKRTASLAGLSGLNPGHAFAPESVQLDGASPWPFQTALEDRRAWPVSGLSARSADLPAFREQHRVTQAACMSISGSGETAAAGFLVAGLNPLRPLDSNYRRFLDLVTAGISEAINNGKAYEAERKRAEALAEIDRAKTAFFSNVSHEFRTPLTLMLGPLEDELRENPNASERLKIAHRNCLRLLKLVNALLDFARIEAGRAKALYEPTDLGPVTADLASHFRSAIERAGLEFKVECSPIDEPAYVDREMWEKIVLNLLSNAFKFTFAGSITLRLQAADGRIDLIVSDTGIGIPEKELPHIFERFHRVQASQGRSYEGTGIGLALVQELTQLHGGTITVESTHGKGSAFQVSIPLGKEHLPPEQVGGSRELASTAIRADAFVQEALRWLPENADFDEASSPAGDSEVERGPKEVGGRTERILVVDDNADMRDHLRRLLGDDYEVSTASNGEEAFERAVTETPDLVLADVMMPKMDGFGLLRGLRSDGRTKSIPVILLSARAGEEARSEGINAGADDYLVKPFSARELLARISARVKQGRLRKADEALRGSLAEKEELLKEVHHRVKNNLQVISSLLSLQANRAEDRQVVAAFEEARNRVYSIGTIHEMLYRSGSFASVDLAAYARKLVPELVRFYDAEERVRVEIRGDTLTMELERAVPCGLILNELVSNVCKHAFPHGQAGDMVVSFCHNGGSLAMSVSDSGAGLPKGFEYHKAGSLGLQLVRNLARQLRATVGVDSENGTNVTIRVPVRME